MIMQSIGIWKLLKIGKTRTIKIPYKFEVEKKKIPRELDKRVKLTEQDRKEIKENYGKISQRKLAKMYDVSRRLIIFIGCPEKYKRNLEQRKITGGSKQYYIKEKNTQSMKKHRNYKKKLNKQNKLIWGTNDE